MDQLERRQFLQSADLALAFLEASTALAAELLSRRIAGTTFLAWNREAGAAFAAEFHFGGVLETALRAPHRSALLDPK